ncbi:Gypsy retrotransposon integrase-like protein 1, partial [Conglomerata obtusa]
MIEPYVTTHDINKIILGQDFILKNSNISINLLKQKKESKNLNVINLDCTKNDPNNQVIQKFLKKHKYIFKDQIDQTILCNIGRHYIKTNSDQAAQQFDFRIPYKWEKIINEEISQNLKNGIIRETNSPWNSRIVPIQKKD